MPGARRPRGRGLAPTQAPPTWRPCRGTGPAPPRRTGGDRRRPRSRRATGDRRARRHLRLRRATDEERRRVDLRMGMDDSPATPSASICREPDLRHAGAVLAARAHQIAPVEPLQHPRGGATRLHRHVDEAPVLADEIVHHLPGRALEVHHDLIERRRRVTVSGDDEQLVHVNPQVGRGVRCRPLSTTYGRWRNVSRSQVVPESGAAPRAEKVKGYDLSLRLAPALGPRRRARLQGGT